MGKSYAIGENKAWKETCTSEEIKELVADEAGNKIGNLSQLNTVNRDNIVLALNECFQFASDGKLAITTVAGLANNSTFQAIANELTEWKRLVAEAGGVCATNENMRTQAAKIVEYVRTNLPNIITNNGGSLVNSAGTGVTAATSTLDTIYHSINNLAVTKNNQITNITNEKNTWYNNYLDMQNQKNTWENLANTRKTMFTKKLIFDRANYGDVIYSNVSITIPIGFNEFSAWMFKVDGVRGGNGIYPQFHFSCPSVEMYSHEDLPYCRVYVNNNGIISITANIKLQDDYLNVNIAVYS